MNPMMIYLFEELTKIELSYFILGKLEGLTLCTKVDSYDFEIFSNLIEEFASLEFEDKIDLSSSQEIYNSFELDNDITRVDLYYNILGALEGYKKLGGISFDHLEELLTHLNLDINLIGDEKLFDGNIDGYLKENGKIYSSDYSIWYYEPDNEYCRDNRVINENPWIDVFGEGEEADTAYLNTQ